MVQGQRNNAYGVAQNGAAQNAQILASPSHSYIPHKCLKSSHSAFYHRYYIIHTLKELG